MLLDNSIARTDRAVRAFSWLRAAAAAGASGLTLQVRKKTGVTDKHVYQIFDLS